MERPTTDSGGIERQRCGPLKQAIDSYLREFAKATGEEGIYLGLYCDGEQQFFGVGDVGAIASREFMLEIGCVFKPLLAAVSLELHARGQIDLSLPIGEYFGELRGSNNGCMVTGWHLLSNTAGYCGFVLYPRLPLHGAAQNATGFARIRNAPRLFWPGSVFSYENSVTSLLAAIVSRSLGADIESIVSDFLLRSFMVQPIVDAEPQEITRGFLAMRLSLPDLLFVVESLGGWDSGRNGEHISSQTIGRLHDKVVTIPRVPQSSAGELLPIGGANGLFEYGGDFFGYDGVSAQQAVGFRISRKRNIALVLGIARPARDLRRRLLRDLQRIICGKEVQGNAVRAKWRTEVAQAVHGDVRGHYMGNSAWYAEVHTSGRIVSVVAKGARGRTLQVVRGRVDGRGQLLFDAVDASLYPTFFRNARTGETCLMIGMTALRRMPVAWLGRTGIAIG